MYRSVDYNQSGISNHRGKYGLFYSRCWDKWIVICKNIKLGPYVKLSIRISSKWIGDLHVKTETIQALGNNKNKFLFNTGIGSCFLTINENLQPTKEKMDKLSYTPKKCI